MPLLTVFYSLCFGLAAGISAAAAWRFLPARWLWSDASRHLRHPHALRFWSPFWLSAASVFFIVLFLLLMQQASLCPHATLCAVFPAPWHHLQSPAVAVSQTALPLCSVLWSLLLLWLLLQSSAADVCYRLLPDQWTAGIALLGLVRLLLLFFSGRFGCFGWPDWPILSASAVLQLLLPTLMALQLGLFCCALLYALPLMVRGTPAIGFGDVKLLLALAAAFPPAIALRLLLISSLLSGTTAIALLFVHRLKPKDGLPFAPFLAAAALWVFLF